MNKTVPKHKLNYDICNICDAVNIIDQPCLNCEKLKVNKNIDVHMCKNGYMCEKSFNTYFYNQPKDVKIKM
jgi:hypothetical protein